MFENEILDWKNCLIEQHDEKYGCIPAGYEWMLRRENSFPSEMTSEEFQDKYSLRESNSFQSVLSKIKESYPGINIRIKENFTNGKEKVNFIKKSINNDVSILVSVANGKNNGWHIMPVIGIKNGRFVMIKNVKYGQDDKAIIKFYIISFNKLASLHDNLEGGKDVSFFEKM